LVSVGLVGDGLVVPVGFVAPEGFADPDTVDPDTAGVDVGPDGASVVVEVSASGVANATPGTVIAEPIPNATANAPTRPM
jgi:hypothetical protein